MHCGSMFSFQAKSDILKLKLVSKGPQVTVTFSDLIDYPGCIKGSKVPDLSQ